MGASRFIGRVGGLAGALGAGMVLFLGTGVAWADETDSSGPSSRSSASASTSSTSARTAGATRRTPNADLPNSPVLHRNAMPVAPSVRPAPAAAVAPVRGKTSAVSPVAAVPAAPVVASPSPVSAAPVVAVDAAAPVIVPTAPTPVIVPAAAVPSTPVIGAGVRAASSAAPAAAVVTAPTVITAAPQNGAPVAASAGALTAIVTATASDGTNAASNSPALPEESPIAWAVLAEARRPQSAAADNLTAPSASASASASTGQQWSGKGITVNSAVTYTNGIIAGVFSVTSDRPGNELTYDVLGGSNGGKFGVGTVPGVPLSFTVLPYATWLDNGGTKGTEQLNLRIREFTQLDQTLAGIPLVGDAALNVIKLLQDVPLINTVLAPIIGVSVVAKIDVDVAALAPGDTPVAYTYKVKSFDGVKISTNFFPASGLTAGGTAPTTIIAPGFGGPGITNPYSVYALKNEVPGVNTLRTSGYNVVSFDPRGEFDSGGIMKMAEPNYEGKDISAIVSWMAANTPTSLNAPGDPKVGMVGGSYGAALQTAAALDPRIDAMVPVDGWSSLLSTFYPSSTFKTSYGALYMLNLIQSGAKVDPQLYFAVATGLGLNWLAPWSKNFLNASNPPLGQQTAALLNIRGKEDVLVPLSQGEEIARAVLGNGLGTPLKTIWFAGGHGASGFSPADQSQVMILSTMAWLNQYVQGNSTLADSLPRFQWFDQKGAYHSSNLMAFQPGFNNLPNVTATSAGGTLGIIPIIGGSGPGIGGLPISLVNASKASNAINIEVPTSSLAVGTQVVGAPKVSFTYQGLGTSRAVYAQVIDNSTGAVLGNIVTPVPVTLNGREHTVSFDIGEIAYTVGEGDSLTIQITSSATAFENPSFGLMKISDVTVTLPNRTA